MKRNVLIGTILLGAVLATQAAPSIYVSNGDALLQYHASSGALLGTVGSFPGFSIGSDSDELSVGPDGALYFI